MAGFDAGQAVEALDFNFEPYAPGAKGTIPEPSDDAVSKFRAVLRDAAGLQVVDGHAVLAPEIQTEDDQSDAAKVRRARVATAVVELCSQAFTAEQYDALPYRLKIAFNGWLAGQFANPTSSTAGTTS